MSLITEKQKTRVVTESGFDRTEVDCFIKKFGGDKIQLAVPPNSKVDFSDFDTGYELDVKIYTPKGIVIFSSEVIKFISQKEVEISYSESEIKIEDVRQNPRYQVDCPITVFRPLLGNIESKLIDISVRGIRFYSDVSLNVNSQYEIMLYLSDTVGKIIFTGRILDKSGLPEGVHRALIEDISYSDRQKLIDYCMSLAK